MSRRTRSTARAGLVIASLAIVAGGATSSSLARAQEAAVYPATLVAEAWYRGGADGRPGLEACGIPAVGCAPVPAVTVPSQYPAGTLHVGVAGSAEESRTYLTLVSAAVPFGRDVVGGTLTLPVLMDTESGTLAPETASIRACLATDKVKDGVEGGLGGAPVVDCTTSSPAVFRPAKGNTGPEFTVDLTPFAEAFSLAEVSLGLVPGEDPGTAWHVALSRSDREAEGARPISAQVRIAVAGERTPPAQDPAPEVGLAAEPPRFDLGSPDLVPVAPGIQEPLAPVEVVEPVVSGSLAPSPARQALVRSAAPLDGDLPPVVLLLPLLLGGGVAWASRLFTRELVPSRD